MSAGDTIITSPPAEGQWSVLYVYIFGQSPQGLEIRMCLFNVYERLGVIPNREQTMFWFQKKDCVRSTVSHRKRQFVPLQLKQARGEGLAGKRKGGEGRTVRGGSRGTCRVSGGWAGLGSNGLELVEGGHGQAAQLMGNHLNHSVVDFKTAL